MEVTPGPGPSSSGSWRGVSHPLTVSVSLYKTYKLIRRDGAYGALYSPLSHSQKRLQTFS